MIAVVVTRTIQFDPLTGANAALGMDKPAWLEQPLLVSQRSLCSYVCSYVGTFVNNLLTFIL